MSGVIVHEWLEPDGGAENVFAALEAAFPDAERWCLWNDAPGRFPDVHETALARTPLRRSKALALPAMPITWRRLPAADAEWVLCSSHLFAHHARFDGAARDAPKLVYAHTPARYIWAPESDARGRGLLPRLAAPVLKPLDRRRAGEAAAIAANSRFVADRIARTWRRDATVIHPPVDVARFATQPELDGHEERMLDALGDDYLLGLSRFVPYKRLDATIDAGVAAGRPVVLAGSGPDERRLREHALDRGADVRFVGRPSDGLRDALYRRAAAVVFAPVEDFGIVPVEAMAAGTPVVANAVGGAAESVVDGRTGVLVDEWGDTTALASAVERAVTMDAEDCRRRAAEFDSGMFEERVRAWVAAETG